VSRDVSVIDLRREEVVATVRSSRLPRAGSREAELLIGKALFHSSTGVHLPALGDLGHTEARLSNEGWSSCVACHPFGLTDNVVWIFGAGPRRTVPLNGSFNPQDPDDAKILNYSAIFDEIQDFENNIRGVSGGLGLITLADGTTPDPVLNAFDPANTGRSERLDLLAEYVARGLRTPVSPLDEDDHDVERGRRQFARANCAACHGGEGWSSSRRDYTPPPPATDIVAGQVQRFLRPVGTFDPTAENEIRQNGAAPLGADGYNPPSLLGVGAMVPVLHNGSALTLEDVLDNVEHRSAGTGGVDRLTSRRNRERLAAFLASIDEETEPFDIRPLLTAEEAKAIPDDEEGLETAAAPIELEPPPGPFRSGGSIAFALGRTAEVELGIYDVQGRRVTTLAHGSHAAGRHVVRWEGTDATRTRVASGIYFVRLRTADGAARTRKIVYTR
jgi:cytochrome c peroxidase